MKNVLGQFMKFAVVGGLAAAVHYSVLVALVSAGAMGPVPASGVGFLVSATFNYWLNYRYTFRSGRSHAAAAPRFAAVATAGLAINQVVVAVLIGHVAHYLLAQIVATACVMVWNFVLGRIWTFGGTRRIEHGS